MKNKKELEEFYLKARYNYYFKDSSIIPDSEYDKIEEELKKLGSKVVEFVDFPDEKDIENLGLDLSKIVDSEKKIETKYTHLTPMLSIDKIQINDEDKMPWNEIENFFNRYKPCNHFICELKYDGNAIESIYRNNKMSQILTRGDKIKGLDKTSKLKYLIPDTIDLDINKTYQIRGEIIINEELWKRKYYNPEFGKVQNARNWIAGILNREEINLKLINDLNYVTYDLTEIDEKSKDFRYLEGTIDVLNKNGFNKNFKPIIKIISSIDEFKDMYFFMKEEREKCPFMIDGIVIKYPENLRKKMGNTGHHPRWAVAIKFPTLEAITRIERIEWKMGKNRELTPVAILEPVILLDTIVTKASLSNLSTMINLRAFPGATVSLKKSGEIIPMITGVIEPSPNEENYLKQFEEFAKSVNFDWK